MSKSFELSQIVNSIVTPEEFGAKGDGTTNDTLAFSSLENEFTNRTIDLGGKIYLTDTVFGNNKYINGFFKAPGEGGVLTYRGKHLLT